MVDVNNRKLVDTSTHIQGILSSDTSLGPSVSPKDTTNSYLTLLSEFPTLTNVSTPDSL